MPNLEEAILAAAEKHSEGSSGSNGAIRPPSPQTRPDRSSTGMDITHSQDNVPQNVLAEKAALALGNDAHSSQDLF